VEQAPPDASLENGAYSVKILKERGNWKAQFIQERKVVASTDEIRLVRFEGEIEKPALNTECSLFHLILVEFSWDFR